MDSTEHKTVEECDLEYHAHVGAPGIGVIYKCKECGRPWLKVGDSYYDPREQVFELQPCDVI